MKHMKKSLFFTTVMMVVLLVVALSTATFAWYTSSNTVTISQATVNSAEATGANIAIGWNDSAPIGANNISFKENTNPFSPMVPNLGGDALDLNDTFLTANLSNGELPNPGTATPYVAAGPSDETSFYVINYSAKATDIIFTCTVTGENAARLRVAIFRVSDNVCVYTNADYFTGTVKAAVARAYTSPETAPEGWAEFFNNDNPDNGNPAFSSTNTDVAAPTKIAAVAPAFVANKYYSSDDGFKEALTTEPSDWSTNYANYSSTQGALTSVLGVAPAWKQGEYYALSAAEPEKLTVPSTKTSAATISTRLAASDGTVGISEAYTVKVWFDGPTQVDAFGGLSANFAITATSNPVA